MTKPYKKPLLNSKYINEMIKIATRTGKVKLNLFVENEDWIAIEGDRTSLEFLGNLLLAFAKEAGPDCLTLDSPGQVFEARSKGMTLYRKP